jgi:cytochrome c peroxidase
MGDPHGLAFSPDGKLLAVTGSGSHELVLLHAENLPWNTDPGDFIDGRLLDGKQHRRVALGGRPMAAVFAGDRVVVPNYLLDSVQVIDVGQAKLERNIALGGAKEPTLARRGEALFYDAKRSHNQWFSCHTCHTDGHTSGQSFDTLNDDSFGTLKLTPTLRNVAKTGPWTWHGWQKDLGASVAKSFTDTMYGPPGSKEDVQAMVTFLETLEHPPLPKKDDPAVARGAAVFNEKANCVRCHRPPLYTAAGAYDVKLDSGGSPHDGFNPPSLNGVSDRGPYLHDGRAKTLEDVLRTWHTPRHLGGPALTEDEERDLLAFLRSL